MCFRGTGHWVDIRHNCYIISINLLAIPSTPQAAKILVYRLSEAGCDGLGVHSEGLEGWMKLKF